MVNQTVIAPPMINKSPANTIQLFNFRIYLPSNKARYTCIADAPGLGTVIVLWY